MAKPREEQERLYRIGGSDPRTGEQRLADLFARRLRYGTKPAPKEKPQPKRPGFGEPAEMSEEQKARIRVLRRQALGRF